MEWLTFLLLLFLVMQLFLRSIKSKRSIALHYNLFWLGESRQFHPILIKTSVCFWLIVVQWREVHGLSSCMLWKDMHSLCYTTNVRARLWSERLWTLSSLCRGIWWMNQQTLNLFNPKDCMNINCNSWFSS